MKTVGRIININTFYILIPTSTLKKEICDIFPNMPKYYLCKFMLVLNQPKLLVKPYLLWIIRKIFFFLMFIEKFIVLDDIKMLKNKSKYHREYFYFQLYSTKSLIYF